jgi:Antitoxin VbhA
MFRFSSTASVTLVEVGWLAPCNAKPVRARRFSFETGSEPSRFFRSETPRTIAQPTETWLLDRYAQPRLFFNDFHVRWTNLRGPATLASGMLEGWKPSREAVALLIDAAAGTITTNEYKARVIASPVTRGHELPGVSVPERFDHPPDSEIPAREGKPRD